MDEKRRLEICAECDAPCPSDGQECPFLKDAELRERYPGALPSMVLDDGVHIDCVISRDAFGYTYRGYDEQSDAGHAVIREYLPYGYRGDNHAVVPEGFLAETEFEEGIPRVCRKLARLSKLRHPGLIRCYAMLNVNQTVYALYENVPGKTLHEFWQTAPAISAKMAADMFAPVAEALQAIFEADIQPDEINPKNVMVRDENGLCALANMGTTFSWNDDTNLFLKTSGPLPQEAFEWHRPPEMRYLAQSAWVYMLSALLCRTLTGQTTKNDWMDRVSAPVRDVLEKGLNKEPENRYQTISEMWQAFLEAAQTEPEMVKTVQKRCFMCMHEVAEDGKCESCGHDEAKTAVQTGCLPPALLQNRYRSGRLLYRAGLFANYIGFDERLNHTVAISEFCPTALVTRLPGQGALVPYSAREEMFESLLAKNKERTVTLINRGPFDGVQNVYDVFGENGTFYAVKEYVSGESLEEVMQKQPFLSARDTLKILLPAIAALYRLHEAGVSHNDVQPQNLKEHNGKWIWTELGNMPYVSKISGSNSQVFKNGYTAPELYGSQKAPCAKLTEQYALGVMAHYMLTGRKPVSTMNRLVQEEPLDSICAMNDTVSPGLEKIIFRAMALNPSDRFESVAEMGNAILQEFGGKNRIETILPEALRLPAAFGRTVRITETLGRDKFGFTYRGYDDATKKNVVIREFAPPYFGRRCENSGTNWLVEHWYRKRFEQNAAQKMQMLSKLSHVRHPGLVPTYAVIEENNTFYALREAVASAPLSSLWEERIWTPEELYRMMSPAVEAAAELSAAGLLESLLPSNFIRNEDQQACLVDIGTTLPAGMTDDLNASSSEDWRPVHAWYAAPEFGSPHSNADAVAQYTICAILIRLLSGDAPPSGNKRLTTGAKLPETDADAGVTEVVAKGMSLEPQDRYPSIHEMWRAFENAAVQPQKPADGFAKKQLCYHCMSELSADSVCPVCGFDNMTTIENRGQLIAEMLDDRYQVGRELGRGSGYRTYIGYDHLMQQKVAIREFYPARSVYRKDGVKVEPFEAEAYQQLKERARQKNIALIKRRKASAVEMLHDLLDLNNTFYVIKEYIEGENLLDYIKKNGPFELSSALRCMDQAVRALQTMHAQGLCHGDLYPGNIIVENRQGTAMLIDVLGETASPRESGIRNGFAPMECYSGNEADAALVDQYLLCATLYFMLTGQKPVAAFDRLTGTDELIQIHELNPSVKANAAALIERGLKLKPEDRYPSVEAFWNEMLPFMQKEAETPEKRKTLWQKLGFGKGKK